MKQEYCHTKLIKYSINEKEINRLNSRHSQNGSKNDSNDWIHLVQYAKWKFTFSICSN